MALDWLVFISKAESSHAPAGPIAIPKNWLALGGAASLPPEEEI